MVDCVVVNGRALSVCNFSTTSEANFDGRRFGVKFTANGNESDFIDSCDDLQARNVISFQKNNSNVITMTDLVLKSKAESNKGKSSFINVEFIGMEPLPESVQQQVLEMLENKYGRL